MLKSREVLSDCKHALNLLEKESCPETFRVLWVAAITLVRTVGDVLDKVDAKREDRTSKTVAAAYPNWKLNRPSNSIFWDFIREERNQVVHEYEIGFFPGPVDLMSGGDLYTLGEHLFCPIIDGPFAGGGCRDILQQAITWWEHQLGEIERRVQSV